MRISRLLIGIPLAAAVTFGLFVLMDHLVEQEQAHLEEETPTVAISIGREVEDTETELKRRLPPRPHKAEVLKEPDIVINRPNRPTDRNIPVSLQVEPEIDPTQLGSGPANQDETPIVRVAPQYPTRALDSGTEGWVIVQFDIMKSGQVDPDSVVVVDSHPRRVFDRSAINAVKKWKYRPKTVNGEPVRREGIQVQLTFDLEA